MYYGTPYDLQSLHIYVLWDHKWIKITAYLCIMGPHMTYNHCIFMYYVTPYDLHQNVHKISIAESC